VKWLIRRLRSIACDCNLRGRMGIDYDSADSNRDVRGSIRRVIKNLYWALRMIFCAERCAPASSSSPERNAQNIMLTDNAKGP
jgi:hypothetical protein